jgi:hypothetical protein
MNYRNSELKIDALVSYLNEEKINLSPAFQRGHIWTLKWRRALIRNIVKGKPIPAVFLYKEASGSKYFYNILDGKQRLESLILFIGNEHPELKITNWQKYFFETIHRKAGGFKIEVNGENVPFKSLQPEAVRELREYAIPTIEITLDDDTSLDEIISLFVDINQYGEPVKRFDIVKALYRNDPFLKSTFRLIGRQQTRGQDVNYKMIGNEFTFVLKRLQVVASVEGNNTKVDRLWEKMLELAMFAVTAEHRKPVDILRGFVSGKSAGTYKLSHQAQLQLRTAFRFLKVAYSGELGTSRLATDQTHFYTMATWLLRAGSFDRWPNAELTGKLTRLASLIEKNTPPASNVKKDFAKYMEWSERQTTDVSRRVERERLFIRILDRI